MPSPKPQTRRPRIAVWKPGQPVPPFAPAEDFAALVNHHFGTRLSWRSIESIAGLSVVKIAGDRRKYIDIAAGLKLFEERFRTGARYRQNGITGRAGASA